MAKAKQAAKLTSEVVAGLKPEAKAYDIWDRDLQRFFARVWPSGKVVFYQKYRAEGGRDRTVKIADAAVMSVSAARQKARTILGDVARGADPMQEKRDRAAERKAKPKTLRTFIDDHYGPWCIENRKAGKNTVGRLRSAFADMLDTALDELTPWSIEKWRSARVKAAGRRDAGNRDLAVLKACLQAAVSWGHIKENPVSGVKLAKVDRQREIRVLEPAEEKAIFDAIDRRDNMTRMDRRSGNAWRVDRGLSPRPDFGPDDFTSYFRPMVIVLLNCGLRRGEALSLAWRDVDLVDRTVTIQGTKSKSGNTRVIPLNSAAFDALSRWRRQNPGAGPDDAVFRTWSGKDAVQRFDKAWKAVMRDAGVVNLTPHCLRHTFASRLIAKGADIETVRDLCGHSSLAVTQIYLHTNDRQKRSAVDLLDADGVIAFPTPRAADADGD